MRKKEKGVFHGAKDEQKKLSAFPSLFSFFFFFFLAPAAKSEVNIGNGRAWLDWEYRRNGRTLSTDTHMLRHIV